MYSFCPENLYLLVVGHLNLMFNLYTVNNKLRNSYVKFQKETLTQHELMTYWNGIELEINTVPAHSFSI